MLKVVVFDSGWGGEMFADYLEERVPVIEVTRVIDWRQAPYSTKGRTDICVLTERALGEYIGRVDVIVLASYAVTVAALAYLKWKYPEQKFVGFEMNLSDYVVGRRVEQGVMVLAAGIVAESVSLERELISLAECKVVRPRCESWIGRVDDGEMTEAALRAELGEYTNEKIGMVLLYSTGFVDLKPALEHIYGRGVMVVDDFPRVARRTCMMLGLKGADGSRRKK